MAFVASLLIVQSLLTICVFFAVAKMYERVVALDAAVARQSQAGRAPARTSSRRLSVDELPVRTRVAIEAGRATSLLVVSPGCASCEAALSELAASPDRGSTLVVSAQDVPLDDRLRGVVDPDLPRLYASEGAVFPIAVALDVAGREAPAGGIAAGATPSGDRP